MSHADALGHGNGLDHYGNTKARMPVDRYASEYNMNHPKRGLALIFNHEHFEIPQPKPQPGTKVVPKIPQPSPRVGTNVDCENLATSLKLLDFDVRVYKDMMLRNMQEELEKVAKMDHSNNDCILITILSHGELGYLYAKNCQYKLDMIWPYFTANRCPTLAGKPKLFFIQACQGEEQLDAGVTLSDRIETDSAGSMSYKIPAHADFLIVYSTIPGFYSWRNTQKGSWFMQSLCQELNQHGKKYDILTLLTFVAQRVAYDFESNTPDIPMMHQQKQIPCVTTMLTRLLRFTDK